MTSHPTQTSITFLHPVYSPKGGIEGALVRIDGQSCQLVFEHAPHVEAAFANMKGGEIFEARIEPKAPSEKGASEHPVHELLELSDDARPQDGSEKPGSVGTVVRLNYARHGEANGVVLDNGDFIHLRPEGQRRAALAIGDRVEASGEARALRFGPGRVIEATQVNGLDIEKPKPKPKGTDSKPAGGKKPPHAPPPHAHRPR